MSNSWTETLPHYIKSRFPARLYLPCAALLVMAALAGGSNLSIVRLGASCILALTLLLQFRLWDDLSDLPHDRQAHPDRVLVKASSLTPFYALLVLSCIWNLALLAFQVGPTHHLGVLVLLDAAYFLWYCFLRKTLTDKVLGYHVIAAKYPMFVFLLSGDGERPWSLLLTMVLVFLCFTMFEVLHDRSLHGSPRIEKVLSLEICVCFAIAVLMTIELMSVTVAIAILQGVFAVIGVVILGELFGRRRLYLESETAGYWVFVVTFALIINFSLGVQS